MMKMRFSVVMVLLLAGVLNADIITFSENWESYTPANLNETGLYDLSNSNWISDGYQYGTATYKGSYVVTGDNTNKAFSFLKEPNHNVGVSYGITSTSVRGGVVGDEIFKVTQDVYVDDTTAGLAGQTPSTQITFAAYRSYLKDTSGTILAGVGISATTRSLRNRQICWYDSLGWHTYADGDTGAWGSEQWLGFEQIVDEVNGTWGFKITDENGVELFSQDNLAFNGGNGSLGSVFLYGQSAGKNDGYNISVDELEVSYVPEPTTITILGLGLFGLLKKRR